MELRFCTWQEVEGYLTHSRAIIMPIGSTEQHGPNGLIGTDALCPEALGLALGAKLEALVAPTISVGMAQHHLGFPGSITLRPSTLLAVLQDTVNSLIRHGFDSFYFLNGHGGNIATVSAAFSEIYAQTSLQPGSHNRPSIRCKLTNWWDAPGVKALCDQLFGDQDGGHATCSEISLTQYAFPESIKSAEMTPGKAPVGPIYDAEDYRRRFPDGRIGSNPTLANPEAGEKIFTTALAGLERDFKSFVANGAGAA